MKITNLYSTPVYSSRVSNYNKIQEELQSVYETKEFAMREDWGSTHYLSDVTFTENLFDDDRVNLFQQEVHKHISQYLNEIKFYESNNYRDNIRKLQLLGLLNLEKVAMHTSIIMLTQILLVFIISKFQKILQNSL
jgi:hypothetical protein